MSPAASSWNRNGVCSYATSGPTAAAPTPSRDRSDPAGPRPPPGTARPTRLHPAPQLLGVIGTADADGRIVEPGALKGAIGEPRTGAEPAPRDGRVAIKAAVPAAVQLLPARPVPPARVLTRPGASADLRIHRAEQVHRARTGRPPDEPRAQPDPPHRGATATAGAGAAGVLARTPVTHPKPPGPRSSRPAGAGRTPLPPH